MMAVSPWKWHLTSSHDSLIKASYIGKNDVSVVGKYNFPLNVFLLASYYYGDKLVQFVILQIYYLVLEVKSLKIKVSTGLHSLWMMQGGTLFLGYPASGGHLFLGQWLLPLFQNRQHSFFKLLLLLLSLIFAFVITFSSFTATLLFLFDMYLYDYIGLDRKI